MLLRTQRAPCCSLRSGFTPGVQKTRVVIRPSVLPKERNVMTTEGQVYVVLVKGKVKEGQAALFEKCFTPLVKHVTANEPGCFSYKLSWSDTDPDSFIIFERYVSKEYLEEVHWKSEPFLQLRKDLEENGVEWITKDITKYYESGPGFMAR